MSDLRDEILAGKHGPYEPPPKPNWWGTLIACIVLAAVILGFLYCPDLTWLIE